MLPNECLLETPIRQHQLSKKRLCNVELLLAPTHADTTSTCHGVYDQQQDYRANQGGHKGPDDAAQLDSEQRQN